MYPEASSLAKRGYPHEGGELVRRQNETLLDSYKSRLDNSYVVVGIPAYNEEVGIGSVILGSKQYADEVIVVDDGSEDRTVEVAKAAGAHVIQHEENKGKGAAIRSLLAWVRDTKQNVDALVLIDGDGQHVPKDIPAVAAPVLNGECDIAIGSRYLEQKETETPLYRRLGQKILDVTTVGSAGANLTDTQSGFRVMSPEAISRLDVRTDGMGVESEMISSATDRNLSIEEVPINVRYRGIDGQTHHPLKHGLQVLAFLVQLFRDKHPLLFFGVPGLLILLAGSLVSIHAILLYQSTGSFHQWRILIGGYLIILGTLGVFSGLLLSQIHNMMSGLKDEQH